MGNSFGFIAAATAVVCLAGALDAGATPLAYTTSGSFNGGGNTYTQTIGLDTLTINYAGDSVSADVPPPANATFGRFLISITNSNNVTPTTTFNLAGVLFDLLVNQTMPGAGSLLFSGSLGGSISNSNSSAFVLFNAPLKQTIDNGPTTSVYSIAEADTDANGTPIAGRDNLDCPICGGSTTGTSIEARVNVVPEPGSMLLFGSGLMGIAALVRRRKQRS